MPFTRGDGTGTEIALIERINGLELEGYYRHATGSQEGFEAMVSAAFQICDELFNGGFYPFDVDFVEGHNVMIEKGTGECRIFDIHAVSKLGTSYEQKIIAFLKSIADRIGDKAVITESKQYWQVVFFINFVKKIFATRPDSLTSTRGDIEKIFRQGDPGYEDKIATARRQWPFVQIGTPVKERHSGQIKLDDVLVAACLKNDIDAFLKGFHERSGIIVQEA